MKIESKGHIITDVPGVNSIEIISAEYIRIELGRDMDWAWTAEEVSGLIAALQRAVVLAQSEPDDLQFVRMWSSVTVPDNGAPTDVKEVKDSEGDRWYRIGEGDHWGLNPHETELRLCEPFSFVINRYGPLTETVSR